MAGRRAFDSVLPTAATILLLVLALPAAVQAQFDYVTNNAGLIQENEAPFGGRIFVAGNRGSAALEPGPGPEGFWETQGKPKFRG